jgi:hypothetical protein
MAGTAAARLSPHYLPDETGNADRDGTVILVVIVNLVPRHWVAGDESDESLCCQRTGIPVAIIARLSLLGSVGAERADALTTELHGIAVRYREPLRDSRAVCI